MIANILDSNIMNIQFLFDEYSRVSYVVDYINKSSRGVWAISTMNYWTDCATNILKTTKYSKSILDATEISSQEASWYFLKLHNDVTWKLLWTEPCLSNNIVFPFYPSHSYEPQQGDLVWWTTSEAVEPSAGMVVEMLQTATAHVTQSTRKGMQINGWKWYKWQFKRYMNNGFKENYKSVFTFQKHENFLLPK